MSESFPFVLTIDVGTSSLKAVVYDHKGGVLAAFARRYEPITRQPGWVEANPQDWWEALCEVVRDLRSALEYFSKIEAVALTGQMHTAVLLNEKKEVVPPTILWLDRRAVSETAELQQAFDLPPYQMNSTYTLPKLVWLARNQPETMAQVHHLLWPKDYLRYLLTGRLLTDHTEAGGAALLDWDRMDWAVERLKWAGISPVILPPLCHPTDDAGPLLPEIARLFGLDPNVKVLVGAGDVLALVTGAPPVKGRLTCSMGSSSMIFYPLAAGDDFHDPAPEERIYVYPLLPYRLLGGVSSTSGASLQWAFNSFFGEGLTFEESIALAMQVAPGAENLVFLPFLSGERSPFWNDQLRGSFYGLTLNHNRNHILRAVMEGVAYSLRYLIDIFTESGVTINEIALAGGGAMTRGWPCVIANICQRRVVLFSGQETVTHGLYAYACQVLEGNIPFEEALMRTFQEPEIVEPDGQYSDLYNRLYLQYCHMAEFANGVLCHI